MDLKAKIFKGIGWNFFGTIVSQGTTFILVFFMARILGNINYGKFNIVQSTVLMISSVSGAGLGITATKFIAQYKSDFEQREKLGRILGVTYIIANAVSLILTFIFFMLSKYIALRVFNDKELIMQFRFASIYVFFFTVHGYQIGALSGFERFDDIAKTNLVKAIINLASAFVLIYFWGLNGAAISMVITAAIMYLYSRKLLNDQMKKYNLRLTIRGASKEANVLLIFTLPAALVGIIGGTATWFSNQLLVNHSVDKFISMSIFSLANNLKVVMLFLPGVIGGVISPILVNTKFNDYNKYRKLFNINILVNVVITILISLTIILFNPIILKIVGKGYNGIQPVLIIIGITAVVEVISTCLFQEIYIYDKIWHNVFSTIIWSLILVIITGFFAKKLGAISQGIAYLFADIFQMLFYLYVLIKNRKKLINKEMVA